MEGHFYNNGLGYLASVLSTVQCDARNQKEEMHPPKQMDPGLSWRHSLLAPKPKHPLHGGPSSLGINKTCKSQEAATIYEVCTALLQGYVRSEDF